MSLRRMREFGSGLLVAASLAVCQAQILPSYPEAAAKVMSLTGQVSVLRDAEPWALNVGDSVQSRQVIVTGPDGFAQFEVSDGSTFQVYPNSNVVFRKNPPNWRDLIGCPGRPRENTYPAFDGTAQSEPDPDSNRGDLRSRNHLRRQRE